MVSLRRILRVCLTLGLAGMFVPAMMAADSAASEKAAAPLTPTFEKVENVEGPPYVLHLKNTSKESLKVSATVLLSVVAHNMDRAREVPEQVVAAGKVVTVRDLAAQDKVTVKVEGFAPLELVVK